MQRKRNSAPRKTRTAAAKTVPKTAPKTAIVTGANRGLGFETARQLGMKGFHVIVAARTKSHGTAAARALRRDGIDADFHRLDMADRASIRDFARSLRREGTPVAVLVNNAGIVIDRATVGEVKRDVLMRTLETNMLGPLALTQAVAPLMPKGGRIVNVSSGAGGFRVLDRTIPAYRVSKAALNALTVMLADEFRELSVNAVCPGWVRTDMGGRNADLSVEEGADTIVWLAAEAPARHTGKFFRARRPIAW